MQTGAIISIVSVMLIITMFIIFFYKFFIVLLILAATAASVWVTFKVFVPIINWFNRPRLRRRRI